MRRLQITRFGLISTCLLFTGLLALGIAHSSPPDVVAAARLEKTLVIYGVVDFTFSDAVAAFKRRYPFIHIINVFDNSGTPYGRFRREVDRKQPSADFIANLAMDMQEKFINDGYSLEYTSPAMANLDPWTHWQNLGYSVGQVPIAFVYNSRFLPHSEMPASHAKLKEMLERHPEQFRHRIAIYEPERSDLGMLLLSQDIQVAPDSWGLFDAIRKLYPRGYGGSREILQHVLSGDQWIGYDVVASFALEMQKTHPELVVVYPSDYTLLISRVAFISANAPHPNTAKLFLNFLLSRQGQEILEEHGLESVRNDVGPGKTYAGLDPIRTQVIRIGPGLLSVMDNLVRAQFLRRWTKADRSNAS